jgi:hypothetical protein
LSSQVEIECCSTRIPRERNRTADSTFKTWERFGLPGLGTVILIDPEGKLVKGDEAMLAEKLKERVARPR